MKALAYNEGSPFYGGQKINMQLADWASKIPSVNPGALSAEAQAELLSITPKLLGGADYAQLMKEAESQFKQKIQ
jgi:lactose/L-arabinose transport system substrate-binding protein